MSENRRLRFPLPGLVLLCVAAVSAFAVGGLWFLRIHERSHERDAGNYLTAVAQYKEAQLSAWVRDQKEDALALQESLVFMAHATSALENPESPVPQSLEDFLHYVAVSHDADDVVLVDMEGRVRFSLQGTRQIHADGLAALAEAMRTGRPVMTDLHLDPSTQEGCVSVAIPVIVPLSDPPKASGGGLLVTKVSRFMDPFLQSWPVPSRTGEALLVRREGEEVLFLSPLRHRAESAMKLRLPLSQVDLPAAMAPADKRGWCAARITVVFR